MNPRAVKPFAPIRLLAFCLLLSGALCAQAQQYRWVDEKGRVQYTDTPPPAGASKVQKKNLGAGPAPVIAEPFALQMARKNAPITLYSSPACGATCDAARALLNKRGIPFTEISVVENAQIEELKRASGDTGVPALLVGRSAERGFEESAYNRILDTAGYPAAGSLPPRNQAAPPVKPPAPAAAAAPSGQAVPAAGEPAKPKAQ